MSKIDQKGSAQTSGAFDQQDVREVRELRTAITSHMSDKSVGDDMAPMMAELLSRLDDFVAAGDDTDLKEPPTPGMGEHPGLEAEASAMSSGAHKVRQLARGANDPEVRANLADMSRVLDAHLARRHEVIARAE